MADKVDFASELFSSRPPVDTTATEKPQPVDFASELFAPAIPKQGAKAPRNIPPKAISDPSRAASVSTSFMGGIPTEKQAAINYFAKARGISPDRYAVIGGDIAYQGNDGKFYKEVVGIPSRMAYNAPDVVEMVPDVATGILSAPLLLAGPPGVAGAVGLTSGVSALSNYVRQKIAGATAGQEVNPYEVGISGGLSLLGSAAPVGVKAFKERRLARDIAQVNPAETAALRQQASKYGIPLTGAELSNLPSLKSTQKVLGNVPESSAQMEKFYREREKKVQSAVDDYLSSLSQVEDASIAGNRGLQALEVQKQNLIRQREEVTKPIYDQAFEASVPVNTQPVLSSIDNMLKSQPPTGTATKYLNRVKSLLEKPGIDEAGQPLKTMVPEDRLPLLHNAKLEIDAMFKEDAFSSLDNTIQAKLAGIKDNLLKEIEKGNPDYIAANQKFAQYSQPLNEFNERITGVSLSQMSKDNLKNFANRIFQNPSPNTIRYAKDQITAGGGEEAWNAVTRAYLEEQWQLAKKPAKSQQGQKLDVGNAWQNVLMGDQKQQKALQVALGKDKFDGLRDLSQVLEAAGRVKKLGSDTAFNQLITEELIKNPPVTNVITGAARAGGFAMSPQNWGKKITDWAIKKDAANNAEQLTDIITSPNAVDQLKQLKRMSPTSAKFWAGLGQVLGDAGVIETRD
jgi:hypothetical protein